MDENNAPEGPVTASEIRGRLNWVEQLRSNLGAGDEFLEAILRNQRVMLQSQAQRGVTNGGVNFDTLDSDGPLTDPDFGALPQDAIGRAAEDINGGDTGPAVFQIQGTRFFSRVRNVDREEIQAASPIRVVDGQNGVTQRDAGAIAAFTGGGGAKTFRYEGRAYRVPVVLEEGEDVKVGNERYVSEEREAVDGTLEPGESKEIARIQPSNDSFLLLDKTAVTSHPTVKYNYFIDDPNDPDPDLSGTVPWASPPDLYSVGSGGYKLVEDFVSLQLNETSGDTQYNDVLGILTGIVIEAVD